MLLLLLLMLFAVAAVDALLLDCRYTRVRLERLSDADMYSMIESAIRGGLTIVPRRWAEANNRYLTTTITPTTGTTKQEDADDADDADGGGDAASDCNYDPDKPTSYIIHYDANNMYGYAMSQKLPFDGHSWLSRAEIDALQLATIADDDETGYVLEVDLDYPRELHASHNEFPLAPERRTITTEQCSPYTRQLIESLNIPQKKQFERLVATLIDKRRYVLHYRCLKLYMRLGLRLVRIHRAVSFKQSFWLRDYIALNTDKRRHATDDFDRQLFKFMNNAVFGKTLENVRKRVDVRLVNDGRELAKLTKTNEFVRAQVITPDLVSVRCKYKNVKLFKPIYVGFAVLDLSKQLLYEFHYDVVKAQYGERATLCYTDTDSLLYHIETDDIYEDITASPEHYDTSNFPRNHRAYSTRNECVPGKMKDENGGKPIVEFVGLRAKMYSCKMACGAADKKVAKGVSAAVKSRRLRHESYTECLWNGQQTIERTVRLERRNHKIYVVVLYQITLSSHYCERFVLDDKYLTRAYGWIRFGLL